MLVLPMSVFLPSGAQTANSGPLKMKWEIISTVLVLQTMVIKSKTLPIFKTDSSDIYSVLIRMLMSELIRKHYNMDINLHAFPGPHTSN